MTLVSGNNEAERADGDRIVVGDASSRHLLFIQVAEEVDRRRPNRAEFVDQIRDGSLVESAGGHVGILVEPWQRLAIATGKAERPMSKYTLGIAEMADHFLDRPFARCIRMQATAVIDAREQADSIAILLAEELDKIAVGHEGNVPLVVGEVLVRGGTRRECRRHGS